MDGISPCYAAGPRFLFEAASIFNKLLLLDEEEREAGSLTKKIYYQECFLDKLSHRVFTSSKQGIYIYVPSSSVSIQSSPPAASLTWLISMH